MLNADKIGRLFGWIPYKEKFELATSSQTTREMRLKLATGKDAQIKISIAHRKDIDPQIIDILAEDPNPNVRFALINSTNIDHIPVEYLEKLAEDPIEFISNLAKEHLARRIEQEGISFFFFVN